MVVIRVAVLHLHRVFPHSLRLIVAETMRPGVKGTLERASIAARISIVVNIVEGAPRIASLERARICRVGIRPLFGCQITRIKLQLL